MSRPRDLRALLAAVLLLLGSWLPRLHELQHVHTEHPQAASCSHAGHAGPANPDPAFEVAADSAEDCDLCLLLRAGRDYCAAPRWALPRCDQRVQVEVAAPETPVPGQFRRAPFAARAPPHLLAC